MEKEAALGQAMVEKNQGSGIIIQRDRAGGVSWGRLGTHMITKQGNKGDPGANTVKPRKALGTKSWPTG